MGEEQKITVMQYSMMFVGFASLTCCINWDSKKVEWEVRGERGNFRYESFGEAADALESERILLERKGRVIDDAKRT